jgi:DnaJ family protein A protein 2
MSDLYGLLGLQKSASADEIKKAYRKEALVKHPDRGGNKEEFQKMQAAYEVLSDPDKRAHYDATGQMPQEGGAPGFGGGGMPDLAAMFGGMFGGGFPGGMQGGGMPFPFFNGGNGAPQMKAARGPNKIHEIGLSLADLYSGKTFKLNMKRDTLCGRCAGRGGTRVENCGQCGGRGFRMRGVQMGPIMSMSQEPCGACGQSGQRVLEECKDCRGKKTVERESVLDVTVEPGMQDGDRITFVGQCSESPLFEKPGDVILIVRAATTDSDEWIRRGADLIYTIEFSLAEMLLGWNRTILGHPSGKPLELAWTGGALREGEVLLLAGLGMPQRGRGEKGVLRIVCRTNTSQSTLSDEQRSALKLVWPDWKEVQVSEVSNIPVRHELPNTEN